MRTIQLGHSPDPDDAFMFYALAQDPPLVETEGWRFRHVLQDIQTLSARALRGELETTAISVAAYPYVADKYAITSCGASMGDGYGPMVVARAPMTVDDLRGKLIAVPGTLTSAFLALQLRFGGRGANEFLVQHAHDTHDGSGEPEKEGAFRFVPVAFDQIPRFVLEGRADAGLLIHEGQLTFARMGLHLVEDLGVGWQRANDGLPLPLGCNLVRRDLGAEAMTAVTRVLRASIRYSLDHRDAAVRYALPFGRDLDHALADKFVGMYVNDWTLDYGEKGREAIRRFLEQGAAGGFVPACPSLEFVS